jgi:hypothetical protein
MTHKKVMQEGEFISRTQKPISKVAEAALKQRVKGISAVRGAIALTVASYDKLEPDSAYYEAMRTNARELISSMNFSQRDAEKELARRKQK